MPERVSNPYRDLSLRQLWEALQRRAGDLLGDTATPRRDTAYLLLTAAAKISPMTSHPTSPANSVAAGQSLVGNYGAVYEAEAKALRHHILIHAADAMGMTRQKRSMVDNTLWDTAQSLALRDESGLRQALALLETTRRPARKGPAG
jgi:hypothetical protein